MGLTVRKGNEMGEEEEITVIAPSRTGREISLPLGVRVLPRKQENGSHGEDGEGPDLVGRPPRLSDVAEPGQSTSATCRGREGIA